MKNLPPSPLAPEKFPELAVIDGMIAATLSLGLYNSSRHDLMVVHFPDGAKVAGAFTKSKTRSADVEWCFNAASAGKARALVVNAGNSNAFTGKAGIEKNEATVNKIRDITGCEETDVFLCATGVIGIPLKKTIISDVLPDLWRQLGKPDFERMVSAISTTDTFLKGSGKTIDGGDYKINISGIAKGSGMIAPNMATMLVYIFTDAVISSHDLQKMVSAHVENTFNAITVDSDTSTSDTLLVFATGKAKNPPIKKDDPLYEQFSTALYEVMLDLALQVVRDGEGAQKFIEVRVKGAQSKESAKIIALAIANSPLVKTAIAGGDANWGRVAMAVGKCLEPINQSKMEIDFCGVRVAENGGAVKYDETLINRSMAGRNIAIAVDVGVSNGAFTAYTCDLTHGYISINGDYRS